MNDPFETITLARIEAAMDHAHTLRSDALRNALASARKQVTGGSPTTGIAHAIRLLFAKRRRGLSWSVPSQALK